MWNIWKGRICVSNFTKKKSPPEHYVAKIISKEQNGLEYQVHFFKQIGNSSKIIKESEELFDVVREDIVAKLPKPIELEGSARTQGQFWFPMDYASFEFLWFFYQEVYLKN